jgi:GntR family transcriptional regulator, carbon starvation induced regulator
MPQGDRPTRKRSAGSPEAPGAQAAAASPPAAPIAREPGEAGATLAESVYDQLRDDVLRGRLHPGQKLGSELRSRFNIGSSPIREALNRLLAEGLVVLEAQKGFRVAPISKDELGELVTARCWIDGAAITAGIARSDPEWEEGLLLALHRLARTARLRVEAHGHNAEWEAKHRQFHRALVGGCGTRWITRISEQLFDAAERYRLFAADSVSERDELQEHRAIVDACLDGDADRATQLLREHYGQTYDVIARSMGSGAAE